MRRLSEALPALLLTGAIVLLSGCAERLIREDATEQMRKGDYETALGTLRGGVARYPESPLLRGGLNQATEDAIDRLVASAIRSITSQNFEEADKYLQRALTLEPRNDRVLKLQADLANEKQAAAATKQAEALAAAKKLDAALRVIDAALQLTPRHPGLMALRHRLQLQADAAGVGTRPALAETRPIALDFRAAPLSVVLDAITRSSGVNFILDHDVRTDGRVTVFLRSARVEDAIDLVANANHLAQQIVDPKTVLLYPRTPEKQREHQQQVIRVFHLSNTDAKTTAAMLRNVLRIKDPFVDERANIVVLRESPDIIAIADRLVALQDMGEPEVMMDVEVIEITSTRLTELGLDFPSSMTFTPLGLAGAASGLTLQELRGLNSSRIGVSPGSLTLNLRRNTGDINILSNPRIRVKNKEKAHILVGDKVPVFTSTANSTGFVSESVNYLDVGLKLDVEPTISLEDDVSLKLGLEVSSITDQVTTSNGSLAYQIGTRNATTTLRLRDGETQLLGGLISNADRSSANKVPGLGDLPVAGRLFSSHSDNSARTELVLAITPHIVRSSPKPDIAQSRMWVGTENDTRLHRAPEVGATAASTSQDVRPGSGASQNGAVAAGEPATNALVPLVPVRATWEAPPAVKLGDVFTVTLNMESANPVHALSIELNFPADKLEPVDISEGAFVRQDRKDASFNHAESPGKVIIGLLRNDPAGATGNGTAITIKFKAKGAGPAEVALIAKAIGLSGPLVMAPVPSLRVEVK
jgi:general secretion pathway protein D